MPPQIPNLRLLLSSANLHTSPLFFSPFKPKPSSFSSTPLLFKPQTQTHNNKPFFVPLSSSPNPKKHSKAKPFHQTRRKNTSLREPDKKDNLLAMEDTESVGFNKRRAEGRDKNDKPKNLQLKVRKLNPVNTICYVQILGTGMDTQDTSPSVLLFFDKQRFIFNAGEGLQRFCTEHKIKLSKIDHIFLSRVCSETAGGLPGLLLTLAGIGDEGISVNAWGPSDFKYLIDAMKSFIPNAAMVHTHSFGPTPSSDGVAIHDPRNFDDPLVLINDEVVKISAILLRPCNPEVNGLLKEEPTTPHDSTSSPMEGSSSKPPGHKAALKPGDISVVYVCELPEIRGRFDPKKAAALGLRPGPKYRDLQLGKTVKSDRQNIMVHPSDVMDPSIPGPIVLLVDCPTSSHLRELLSTQSLSSYYAARSDNPREGSKIVNCVIHLSPSSIINTSDYQEWMSRFGGAQHILAGHEMKNIEIPILKSSARIATRLNYLCPQFFPAPGFWSLDHLKSSSLGPTTSSEVPRESISAENLLKFNLRPYAQLGLDRSVIPTVMSPSEIIEELLSEIPEIIDAAEEVTGFCRSPNEKRENDTSSIQDNNMMTEEPWLTEEEVEELPSCLKDITREDTEIVLLGTGSSQPSKYRNVSSIFINLFSKGSLLLDCGEGTLGQLRRRYGIEGADDAVRGLRCIWISHIHADHHTGLARILAKRHDLLNGIPHEPLIVIGPRQLKRYLDAYERLEGLDMQFLDWRHTTEDSMDSFESFDSMNGKAVELMNQPIDSTLFAKGSRMQSHWKRPGSPVDKSVAFPIVKSLKKALGEAGLEGLISFPVVHCPQACGVALKAAERVNNVGETIPGWKIVYSGDTRPCPELVKASHGATVLIHEATFEDAMVDEAIARNHSTTKEAVEVGDSAGVYRIILTHFSQRYPKIPVFDESHMHNTCIGFDLMSVNLADLHVLPKVLPHLKLLFRNEMIVDESEDLESVVTAAE